MHPAASLRDVDGCAEKEDRTGSPIRQDGAVFGGSGIRKDGPTEGGVKKCPVDTFLVCGRINSLMKVPGRSLATVMYGA